MAARQPSDFVKCVLHNGVGRYVCQLQRITFKFCKSFGSSRGMRDFIENDLVDYARDNSGVVVYLQPRRHRTPVLDAEYLNGHKDYVNCHNYTREEVVKYVDYLTHKSGFPVVRLRKFWHTDSPSIQGVWTPFTRMDPRVNVLDITDQRREQLASSRAASSKVSATEILRRIAEANDQGSTTN